MQAKYSNFGDQLRNYRRKQRFTQTDLANVLEMHPQYVSNWERGLCAPPKNKLKLLSKALQLNKKQVYSLRLTLFLDVKVSTAKKYKNLFN